MNNYILKYHLTLKTMTTRNIKRSELISSNIMSISISKISIPGPAGGGDSAAKCFADQNCWQLSL